MKKFTIKSLALTLALTLLTTTAQTIPAEAKASPKLSYKTDELCAPSWDLKGTSVQFRVKNAGGKKVTWKSSNKSVATVSKSGLVKALKRGNVTISAKVGKKTLKKTVWVHKHSFRYYNPEKGCKYCKCETPSYFYSVETARRDMEQFVKDITTPGMTDVEKMRNFRLWNGMAHFVSTSDLDSNDNWSTVFYVPGPELPKTAYKYCPDWSQLDGHVYDDTLEQDERKIMDEWCKPRYDKYGQQIPRVTMAEVSYANGCEGLYDNSRHICAATSDRCFLFAHMIGLETCLIESEEENHRICLYKIDGRWWAFDTASLTSKKENGQLVQYAVADDFKEGEPLESFYRVAYHEANLLDGIDEFSSDGEYNAYSKANKDLPADLRP